MKGEGTVNLHTRVYNEGWGIVVNLHGQGFSFIVCH